MNGALSNGIVKAIDGMDVPIYIVKEQSQFSITEYKVMENLVSLLRCAKTTLNGETELVYLRDGVKPIKTVLYQLSDDKIARVIRSFLDALVEINSNGFLRSSNLDISLDKVFVDPETLTVRLIYIPVNSGFGEYGISVNEVNDFILSVLDKAGNPDSSICSAIKVFCISNTETSVERSRQLFKQLMQQYRIEDAKDSEPEELRLNYSDGSQERVLYINQDNYTIGHMEGSADGIIGFNRYISSPHCEITHENNKWYIKDLDSTNGTFVNGSRLSGNQKAEIKNSDAIRLANSTFYVEIRRNNIG